MSFLDHSQRTGKKTKFMDFRVIGFEWLLKTPYERDPHHSSNRIFSLRQKSNQIN